MSAHEQVNSWQDAETFTRTLANAGSAIAPHVEKLCTPNGIVAVVTIAVSADSVASGEQDPETYVQAIKLAANFSGVPVSALSAYGDLLMAMAVGHIQNQPPSDGDKP
jgi:hypothetical protein